MKTVQLKKVKNKKLEYLSEQILLKNPLVLIFGNRYMLEDANIYHEIREEFKDGHLVFGSTSGDITPHRILFLLFTNNFGISISFKSNFPSLNCTVSPGNPINLLI